VITKQQYRMKIKRYTPYFIAALLAGACQSNPGTGNGDEADKRADTLVYEYKDYIKYSQHIIQTSETTDTSFFSVSYPEFRDSAVNRFVMTSLLGNDTATVEASAQAFIGDFDQFWQSDPYPRVWTSQSHAKVYRITPSYLALSIDAYSYTGGAHGNYATVFRHYDLLHNVPLTMNDIVTEPYQNELAAVAERYFRKQENLSVNEPLEEKYFFEGGQFSLPENFALERDSMLFLYNIYEIKPYVDGQTELRVPYSEFNRLLTDRAKRIVSELNL